VQGGRVARIDVQDGLRDGAALGRNGRRIQQHRQDDRARGLRR
jgi:hypothetical protein